MWKIVKLSDVCTFHNGKAHEKDIDENGQFKLVNSKFVSSNGLQAKRISDAKFPLCKNDIVMVMSDVPNGKTLAKCFLVDKNDTYSLNQRVCAIRTSSFDYKFLFYQLNRNDYFLKFNNGENQTNLRRDDILNCKLALPPLSEQKRIALFLDKTFEEIDLAIVNAKVNLKNSKELYSSFLESTLSSNKEKWELKKLVDVCVVERGGSPRPIKKYLTDDKNGVNWIKIGDTKGINKYLCSTKQKITKEGAKKSRYVKEGDFILSNSMSFGKPYIMKTDGYIHDGWFVLRLNKDIDTEYFYYLLSSPYVNKQFHDLANGAIVKNISGDLVKKVTLPIPPIADQKNLVKQFDKIADKTRSLENVFKKKIVKLNELKKSILKQALNGKF